MDEPREIVARTVPSGATFSEGAGETLSTAPIISVLVRNLLASYSQGRRSLLEEPGRDLVTTLKIQLDYRFIESTKILMLRFVNTHVGAATQVATKGPEALALKWAERVLENWGVQDFTLHCDQESSILAVAQALQKSRKF